MRANIGVFFDGTGNNAEWVEPLTSGTQRARRKDSNVYRLFNAYPRKAEEGNYRVYIPGLGTPFPEIGETQPAGNGMGFGEGGEARILFGMLQLMNVMHMAADHAKRVMFQPGTIKSLCSQHMWVQTPPSTRLRHQAALKPVNLDHAQGGGLLSAWPGGGSHQTRFFKEQNAKLSQKIAQASKPKLVEVFIDVFGFSRGAAEARVFCNWIDKLFQGEKLFGVKAHIRFLGIFDTVASVGMPASATGFTDGHLDWADAPNLRVPSRVKNCEHYVAAHENRGSFPVELVNKPDGALPSNCRQFIYPGMHSDVGGGYTPSEQGRGPTGRNSEKLAQISLNDMYAAARAAKVPLDKALATEGAYDPFQIAPALRTAYDGWKAHSGGAKPLREWLFPYLAWRYQVRSTYPNLPSVRRASSKDRGDLVGANATLMADVEALANPPTTAQRTNDLLLRAVIPVAGLFAKRRFEKLAPEAAEIYRRAKRAAPTPAPLATVFADFAHDSFAGFRPFDTKILGFIDPPGSWESEGYFRWRVHYRGDDTRLTQRFSDDSGDKRA
ncbi:T6SS phospholipase effector Tle1-like catalytic domain-containing protein [Lysobacter koreensis]|uniref:T6SS phospholipase effector Tle1-like catalytic domain-containing protein n=1 Tax=Lysobacter koreensis TaxID=266122 RepID=A0ABW2YS52_9GAMM